MCVSQVQLLKAPQRGRAGGQLALLAQNLNAEYTHLEIVERFACGNVL